MFDKTIFDDIADLPETKTCRTCLLNKPVTAFYKARPGKYQRYCRDCFNSAERAKYALTHPPVPPRYPPGTRRCCECLIAKPLDEFYNRKKKTRYRVKIIKESRCKPCSINHVRRRQRRRVARMRAALPPVQKVRLCKRCMTKWPVEKFKRTGSVCRGCRDSFVRPIYQMPDVQVCKECGEAKPACEFDKSKTKGVVYLRRVCRKCMRPAQRQYGRDWTAQNQIGQRAKERRRRAAIRGAEGSHTPEDIDRIRKAQKDRCCFPWCRTPLRSKGHIEHRMALVNGGSNNPSNLQLSCGSCNSMKGSRDEIEFVRSRGLLI